MVTIGITIVLFTTPVLSEDFSEMNQKDKCKSLNVAKWMGPCQSDWAIAAATVVELRTCLRGVSELQNIRISYMDPICNCEDCHAIKGNGCMGGNAYKALQFMDNTGVTGGADANYALATPDFGTKKDRMAKFSNCLNYFAKECYRYTVPGGTICTTGLPAQFDPSKHCLKTCNHPSYTARNVTDSRAELVSSTSSESSKSYMETRIKSGGPVVGYMEVYEDLFMNDGTEVYIHSAGQPVGYHAVVITGFGTDSGTGSGNSGLEYWEVLLPFGKEIGKGGYVKIYRGVNHCNIEEKIHYPNMNSL